MKVARIFNTYGPRMHPKDGRVVSTFIMQALRNQPITVFGDGSQIRSFCFVDDTIEALLRLMRTADEVTGPINIGNPEEIRIGTLAETVKAMTGSRSEIIHLASPADDPAQRCPDIALARAELDWAPTVALREGLARTIAYFETWLQSRDGAAATEG